MSSLTIADGKAKIKKLLKKAQVYEVGIVDSIIDGVFSEMNLDTKPSKSIEEAVEEIFGVEVAYAGGSIEYEKRVEKITSILQSIHPSEGLIEKVEALPITTLATGKNGAWVTYIDKDSVLSFLKGKEA